MDSRGPLGPTPAQAAQGSVHQVQSSSRDGAPTNGCYGPPPYLVPNPQSKLLWQLMVIFLMLPVTIFTHLSLCSLGTV